MPGMNQVLGKCNHVKVIASPTVGGVPVTTERAHSPHSSGRSRGMEGRRAQALPIRSFHGEDRPVLSHPLAA